MDIAGQYEWYNVNDLLQIMKEELANPGFIKQQGSNVASNVVSNVASNVGSGL
jgi:hypothetical protein